MPQCVAPGCKTRSGNGIVLKRVPKDEFLRQQWLINLGRPELEASHSWFVCECHFEPSQYERTREDGRRRLKDAAIPTIFMNNFDRQKRWKPLIKQEFPDQERKPLVFDHFDHNYFSTGPCVQIVENASDCGSDEVTFNSIPEVEWVIIKDIFRDQDEAKVTPSSPLKVSTAEQTCEKGDSCRRCKVLVKENVRLRRKLLAARCEVNKLRCSISNSFTMFTKSSDGGNAR